MLVLARKINESIVIDGRIVVKIVRLDGDVVKLGISAPADVPVHRREVYEEIQRSNQQALINPHVVVPKLLRENVMPLAMPSSASDQKKPSPEPTSPAKTQSEDTNPRNHQ